MIHCVECVLLIELLLRNLISKVLCCMVFSDHFLYGHVIHVEVFCVLVLILIIL